MTNKKEYIQDLTESGDRYSGTQEAWDRYDKARSEGDYETIQKMEEGFYSDFFYTG